MPEVALIDYGSGNLRSAEKALTRAAEGTDAAIVVTADPERVLTAARVVLPGVGAFADCMAGVSSIPGMVEALTAAVRERGAPFLGICVGMQLLADVGREFGDTKGLGWIGGEVVRLAPGDPKLKVPHMGWNALHFTRAHPVFAGIAEGEHFYFVHSYEFRTRSKSDRVAETEYGGAVTAAIARGNVVGVQFHPEKSQAAGLKLLANFLAWQP